jgi:predicted metal-dependent peptidase
MRKKFVIPKPGGTLSIAKSYRTILAKLMSNGTYSKFNFFADILSGLQTQEDPTTKTFSIQVSNGHYLMKYSPDMVKELDVFGAGIVICHELGHPALHHTPRMIRIFSMFDEHKKRLIAAAGLVHIAADYALNSWLIDVCGIFTLVDLKTRVGVPIVGGETFEGRPMGSYAGIHPSDVELPPGKSMEWYVDELCNRILEEEWDVNRIVNPAKSKTKDNEASKGGDTEGSRARGMLGKLGEVADKLTDSQLQELMEAAGINPGEDVENLMNPGENSSPSELADQLTREFTRAMIESAESIKSRGTLPGNIAQYIEELNRPPQVDWRQELRNYCKSAKPSRSKTTLSRPKRKHISIEGAVTSDHPGKKKNPSYKIVFAIDTSGSVSSRELQEIFNELRGILNCNEGTEVTVVECDTCIGRIYDLAAVKDVDTQVSGRGGTSFDPVFQWIRGDINWGKVSCSKQPDLFIYATDGECSLPPSDIRIPQSKMLWLISSRGRVPCEGSSWGNTRSNEIKGYADYGRFIRVNALS